MRGVNLTTETTMTFDFAGRYPAVRMRRMRRDDFSRRLMRETRLSADDLIYPVFVLDGSRREEPVASLPGVSRKSIDLLLADAERCVALGIPALALFPVIAAEHKSLDAAAAWDPEGLVPRTVRALKQRFPDLGVITDVALDPYTSHGQDGLLDDTGYVANDDHGRRAGEAGALPRRGRRRHGRAVGHDGRPHRGGPLGPRRARAATGCASSRTRPSTRRRSTARSAMRSGRRATSAAATSTPTRWTRPTRTRHCGRSHLDLDEAADMVMVKPGMPYLDIVRRVKDTFGVPTAVYQVSGEYAMLKAAAQNGWLDERACALEALTGMKRAGADAILTYYAMAAAAWLKEGA